MACSSNDNPGLPNSSQSTPSAGESAQKSGLELEVLRALEDDYLKGVALDPESGDVIVTVFTNGIDPSDDVVSEYKRLAAEVAPGWAIIVELDPGEAPSPD